MRCTSSQDPVPDLAVQGSARCRVEAMDLLPDVTDLVEVVFAERVHQGDDVRRHGPAVAGELQQVSLSTHRLHHGRGEWTLKHRRIQPHHGRWEWREPPLGRDPLEQGRSRANVGPSVRRAWRRSSESTASRSSMTIPAFVRGCPAVAACAAPRPAAPRTRPANGSASAGSDGRSHRSARSCPRPGPPAVRAGGSSGSSGPSSPPGWPDPWLA